MQRFFDIILSLTAILLLSPFLILIILILKFTGEGEIFYIQKRIGINGNPFGAIKFATMLKNSEVIGTGLITTKQDPRVLFFGRFLRKTKLNELPQLFNILFGDMSFVGPRPQVKKHFDYYPENIKSALVKIRPGLTGIGSIVFRDEEAILEMNKPMTYEECYSQLIAPYKGELELWYIKNNSIWLYFKLIFMTAWVVFFSKSQLHSQVFRNIPSPPAILKMKYS